MANKPKVVTVECVRTGGQMDVRDDSAKRLVSTKRWKYVEEPVEAPSEVATSEELTEDDLDEIFGEDHED